MSKKISIKLLYFITIFFIIIINIVFFYYKKATKNLVYKFKTEIDQIVNENVNQSSFICDYIEKVPLDFIRIGTDFDNSEFHNYTLVFRFYSNSCGSCVEKEFSNLKLFSTQIGAKNIVLLPINFDFMNLKTTVIVNDVNNYKIVPLVENAGDLEEKIFENKNLYFIVDSTRFAYSVFSPNNNLDMFSKEYLRKIITKYFTPQ